MLPNRMPSTRAVPFVLFLGLLALPGEARAANGDLLATHSTLLGKTISGICADSDGTFWALGEATAKIYHLDSSFALLGEITNPHGKGVFPDLILSRGIAFRPSTQTLLVLAKDGPAFKIKEVDRAGVQVLLGAFTIDGATLPPNANLYGLAYDAQSDRVWSIDDYNDLLIRSRMDGVVVTPTLTFPRDTPAETTLRGTGLSLRQEGVTTYVHLAYGDIFTLAPSRILQLTLNGLSTGVQVPLSSVPREQPGAPLREVGAVMAAAVTVAGGGSVEAAVVVGRSGVIHVLERSRPDPIPPSFFQARVTVTNEVVLTWENHGTGQMRSYPGGLIIGRDGVAIHTDPSGSETRFVDLDPPPDDRLVEYTIKGSNFRTYSVPSTILVQTGKGALVDWVPFPGGEPFDVAVNPAGGDLYITDSLAGVIYRFDRNLDPLGTVPSPFQRPGGIAFNPSGDNGAGSLMVGQSDGVLIREIKLSGTPLDFQTPVDFRPIPSPRMGGMTYDPAAGFYTCIETSTRQLVTFDRNGQNQGICTPPEIFTQRLSEGLAFDALSGNFQATFEDQTVREAFKSCAPTNFNFELRAIGETASEPGAVRGVEVSENTLLVCGAKANAVFRLLVFPQGASFIRGDVDRDGAVRITDAVGIAEYLFKDGPTPACLDSADTNDDGFLDISDPVYLLFSLFLGGPAPPAPTWPTPGIDPTFRDDLEC